MSGPLLAQQSGPGVLPGGSGGGGGAPTSATYITQTANGDLSAEQALASLSSGIMRVATTTGVVSSLTDSAGIAANISDETGTGVLAFSDSPVFTTQVDLAAAGVRASAADGVLTLLGLGNGNDENLTFDFDNAAANTVAVASGTGVAAITFGAINLATTTIDSGVANTALIVKTPTGSTAAGVSVVSGSTVRGLFGGNNVETYIQGQPSLPISFYNGAGSTVNMAILDAGALRIGSWTAALTAGALGLPKMTASGTAPGAAGLKLEVVCGTNAGTAKIIAYAGTSTTATTVLDNIGSGVTGC